MSERDIQSRIQLAHSNGDTRLFRNNVGQAWQAGGRQRPVHITYKGVPGMFVPHAIPVRYGLFVGSGDLIGWRSVTITEQHVGIVLARFASIEVKDKASVTEDQARWADTVRRAGGLAGIAHSEEEAHNILEGK